MYLCVTVKSRASCLIPSSIKFLLYYLSKIQKLYLFNVCEDTHAIAWCKGQMTAYKSWFSSVMWVPGIQLKQSVLATSTSTHWVLSLVLSTLVFHWTQTSPILPYLLAQEFQGFAHLHLSSTGHTGPLNCAHLFIGLPGSNWGLYTLQGVCVHARTHTQTRRYMLLTHHWGDQWRRPNILLWHRVSSSTWSCLRLAYQWALRSCLQPPVLELQAWVFFYMGGRALNFGVRDSPASALMH